MRELFLFLHRIFVSILVTVLLYNIKNTARSRYKILNIASTIIRNLPITFYISMIVFIVYWWIMFERAGIKGWFSVIPFVNLWKICEVIYGAGWKMFILLIIFFVVPFIPMGGLITLLLMAFLPYRVCQAYGKDDGLSVAITYLLFLGSIAMIFTSLARFNQVPLIIMLIYQCVCFNNYKGPVKDFI